MATFTVQLKDGHQFTLPLDTFREMFPECIWTSALEGVEESGTLIEVENPVVTIEVMALLTQMTQTKRFGHPSNDITPEGYRAAHRYLNIPIFASMAWPEYETYL